jgi:hypothetical protein
VIEYYWSDGKQKTVEELKKEGVSLVDLLNMPLPKKEPNPKKENDYLYIINKQGTSEYKIGRSVDPEKRMKTLQTGNSEPLILILKKLGYGKYEDNIQKILKKYNIRGEWYDLPQKILFSVFLMSLRFELDIMGDLKGEGLYQEGEND